MNIKQHFSTIAAQAAEQGKNANEVISQRERLFNEKIVPALVAKKANDVAIKQARTEWYKQTDQVMQSAGLIPKAGQSSASFAKDKRAERAIKKSAETGSKLPIIGETILSTAENIGNTFGQGVGSTIESLAGFVRDIGENETDSISARTAEYGKNLKKGYEASASTLQKEIQAGKHGKVPQLASGAVQSVPAMALPMGAARGAAVGAAKLGAGAAAPYIGLGVGAVAGHTQNYGEVRRNATENLERDFPTWQHLQGNPVYEAEFNKYLQSGMDINQAKAQAHKTALDLISENAADKYGSMMTGLDFIAPSGAVLGSGILKKAPTSKVGKILAGGEVSSELVKRQMAQAPRVGMAKLAPDLSLAANKAALGMVGKQALEEGLQGAIGEYGGQAASANIGGQSVQWGDVGKAFLEEAAIGGIMGGGMQSASRATPNDQAKTIATDLRNQTNRLRQEEAAARKELSDAIQLGDQDAINSATTNLGNIATEAAKVKSAYEQYGVDVPYFVSRFAEQAAIQPTQQDQPEQVEQSTPEQQVQPAQPQPTPQTQPKSVNMGMADTTNLVMDSVSKGKITPDEASEIQSNPILADVFRLSVTGDEVAAHNVVMNAVSLGNITPDQAQSMIQAIPRYKQLEKPSLSGIVNNHVQQQVQQSLQPQDDLFSGATELDPETFEPIQQEQSGIIPDDPNLTDFGYQPKQNNKPAPNDPNLRDFGIDVPEAIEPVAPVPNQAQPEEQAVDFSQPKTFSNYIRANDYLKSNNLQDSHEIVKRGEGLVTVRPKSIQSAAPQTPVAQQAEQNQAQIEPVQPTTPDEQASVNDLASDEAIEGHLNAVPPINTPKTTPEAPQARSVEPITPEPSKEFTFAEKIKDAHISNPKIKPQLINEEVAKGRPRSEVLKEVADIVKAANAGAPSSQPTITPVEQQPLQPKSEQAFQQTQQQAEQGIEAWKTATASNLPNPYSENELRVRARALNSVHKTPETFNDVVKRDFPNLYARGVELAKTATTTPTGRRGNTRLTELSFKGDDSYVSGDSWSKKPTPSEVLQQAIWHLSQQDQNNTPLAPKQNQDQELTGKAADIVHQEQGETEKATNNIIRESFEKADRNLSDVDYDKMLGDLTADIESAIKQAPKKPFELYVEWFDGKREWGFDYTPSTEFIAVPDRESVIADIEKVLASKHGNSKLIRNDDFDKALQKALEAHGNSPMRIVFDVKGDGRFNIRNNAETLSQFLNGVQKNAGFKKIRQSSGSSSPRMSASYHDLRSILIDSADDFRVLNGYEMAKSMPKDIIYGLDGDMPAAYYPYAEKDFLGEKAYQAIIVNSLYPSEIGDHALVTEDGLLLVRHATSKQDLEKKTTAFDKKHDLSKNPEKLQKTLAIHRRNLKGKDQAAIQKQFEERLDREFNLDELFSEKPVVTPVEPKEPVTTEPDDILNQFFNGETETTAETAQTGQETPTQVEETPATTETAQDIGRASDNAPFANESAANMALRKKGLESSHEVIKLQPSQFILRKKSADSAPVADQQLDLTDPNKLVKALIEKGRTEYSTGEPISNPIDVVFNYKYKKANTHEYLGQILQLNDAAEIVRKLDSEINLGFGYVSGGSIKLGSTGYKFKFAMKHSGVKKLVISPLRNGDFKITATIDDNSKKLTHLKLVEDTQEAPKADTLVFPLDKVKEAYSHAHLSPANTARSFKESFDRFIQSEINEAQPLATTDEQKAALKDAIDWVKDTYINKLLPPLLSAASATVSSARAGRNKFNSKQANQRGSALDKATSQFDAELERLKGHAKLKVLAARTPEQKQADDAAEAKAEKEKAAAEQAKVEATLKAQEEAKANKKRASNEWITHPESAERMTMEQWKAIGKDYKGITDGVRRHMGVPVWITDEGQTKSKADSDRLKVGDTITFSEVFDYALPNQPYKVITSTKTKITLEGENGGQFSFKPNILNIEKGKNPDIYTVAAQEVTPVATPETPAQDNTVKTFEQIHEHYNSVVERLENGAEDLTIDEVKQAYSDLMQHRAEIEAGYSSQTKQQLLDAMNPYMAQRAKSDTKASIVERWVNNEYRKMDFSEGGMIRMTFGEKRSIPEIVQEKIEKANQDDLNKYLEERRKAKAEREAEKKAYEAGLNDPKTVDDFNNLYQKSEHYKFIDFYRNLPIAQQALYDELKADQVNEQLLMERERQKAHQEAQRPSQAVSATTGATLYAGKHTKKGHDIWTVHLTDRVERDTYTEYNSKAKELGGYYSSYRGGGAATGFVFSDEATAQEFLNYVTGEHSAAAENAGNEVAEVADPQAEVEVFDTDAKTHADKLRQKAQAVIDRGEENLNRDRKTNTHKRAGEAARAEEAANRQIFLGETLNNIADAIENGSSKHLRKISALTQLREIESILQLAANEQQNITKAKEKQINASTIGYAEYPQYKFRTDTISYILSDLRKAKPSLAAKLESAIDDHQQRNYEKWLFEKNEFGAENYLSVIGHTNTGSIALFKTSKQKAEAMTKRANAGLDTPKFYTLKLKNGEYAVVSSYQRAIESGDWKPTVDNKQIILKQAFGDEIYEALKAYSLKDKNYSINWLIERDHTLTKRMRALDIYSPANFRAMLREYLSMRSAEKGTDPIKEMERSMIGRVKDGLDFFPTPRNVVEQMIDLADLNPEMKVLEPSAGMGHIADILKEYGVKPDVVELSGKRQDLLKLKGYSVVGNDFLMFNPENRSPNFGDEFKTKDGQYQGIMRGSGSLGSERVRLVDADGKHVTYASRDELELVKKNGTKYDRIVMNPPFSDRRDAEHIYHAYELLADDGVLVSIAGEGVFTGSDKKAKQFQDWLDAVGAEVIDLEAGVFNDPNLPVTTGVKSRIIKVKKADSKGKKFSIYSDISRSDTDVQGSTPEQVRSELVNRFGDDVISQLEQNGTLNIIPSYAEKGVEGFAENGQVTLVADAITADNIVPVFLHELGGHIGMQGVMKPQAYSNLMAEFNRLVKTGNPQALQAKKLAERESGAEVQADEYLPYLITVAAQAQQNANPAVRLVNRILSAVKAWAVDKLGLNLKLNPNDLVALAERMVKTVSKNPPPTPPKGERRYSRNSAANPQNMSHSKQREFLDTAAKTAFGGMVLRGAEGTKTLSKRTLNLFQTMLHKSLTDETGEFKKTFDLVQDKINHVTFTSAKSMDVAPSVLTQLETGADYVKEVKRVGRALGNTFTGGTLGKAKIDLDIEKVGNLMFENTLQDQSKRHSEAELKKLGFDDDQIGIYNEIRSAIDSSLDTFANTTFSNIYKHLGGTTEEVLELAARDLDIHEHYKEIMRRVIDMVKNDPKKAEAGKAAAEGINRVYNKANDLKAEGYVPLMRFGKYFIRVFNPTTGEVAYRQHYESESERNIEFDKQKLDEANLPAGYVLEKSQLNELEYKLFQGVSPETVALFAKESGLPIGDAEAAYIKHSLKNNHALKRLLKRQGIKGFDTDIKRVLASFVLSNSRYSANQTYNPAIDESITEISNPAYQEDAVRLRDYSLDTQEELAGVKNFAFVYYMGFSAMFGLVNLTQPFLQTLPYLMQYSKDYGITAKSFMKAIQTWRKGTNHIDPKYKAYYERARKEGHLDPQNTWMLQGLERGKSGLGASTWQLISHSSGLFAQASETVNRRTSLFAALDVAESLGQAKLEKLGFKDAYDFAVRTIQETQGIYNKGNRPRVARGNVGSILMMYKQFMIAYIEQMVRMQKSGLFGGEDDEFKKKMAGLVGFGISRSVLVALGILFSLSGTTGLPFVRDILDGIETAGGLMGKPVNTEREIQIALQDALGQTLGSTVNKALMDGFVNLQPVLDVKGRMGMGDLIPATAYFSPTTSQYQKSSEVAQIGGAIGGLIEKVRESVELAQVGSYGMAGVQLLPKAATSFGQGLVAATTGDYRNMKTGVKTNDATVLDGVVKMLDAQPAGIAEQGRIRGLEMRDRAVQQSVNARWKERYVQALESGDRKQVMTVKQQIREYNRDNPRYPITFNQKTAETNFNKSNQSWQEKRKNTKGLEWMDDYNPHI